MATPKTIILSVNDVNGNYLPTREANASEIVTPGDVVGLDSSGELTHQANTVLWHGYVVVESEYALESSTVSAIDDTYAADERAFYVKPRRGDVGYLWITDGETIAIGDYLVMGNDTGKLVERTTEGLELVVGIALEATSPSGANGRCRVEFV